VGKNMGLLGKPTILGNPLIGVEIIPLQEIKHIPPKEVRKIIDSNYA